MKIYRHTMNIKSLLICCAMFGLAACSSNQKQPDSRPPADSVITVTTALPSQTLQNSITASGEVEAAQSATISTRMMGYITAIKVKVGDRVQKGQLLVTISNQDLMAKRQQANAAIAAAQANFNNAQKDYNRFTKLYQQQSASAKELDNVTLQYDAAKSNLLSAKELRKEVDASLAYTAITAPFSGNITQKMMDPGSMASPGAPILVLEQDGRYQVSASVTESEVGLLHAGAPAVLYISSINKTIKANVSQVSESAAETGGQYLVKIAIPAGENTGVYAGMYVNVTFPVPAKQFIAGDADGNAIMVPASSIVRQDQLTGLYIVDDNQAMLRWVRLGKTAGTRVEVLSGLNPKEKFIVSASGRLYNGAPVKVQ